MIDEAIAGLHLDGGEPPAPVAALDADGETVITIGSMSKTFWAGLRIGWVRRARRSSSGLATARAALDISSPVLEQLMAVELLAGAEPVLQRQRVAARARRDILVAALRDHLPAWRFAVPNGGLSLWVELDAPRSTALAAVADRHGLRLAAGPRFGGRWRVRAVHPPALQPAGAGAGGRRGAAGGRLAGGHRVWLARGGIGRPHSSHSERMFVYARGPWSPPSTASRSSPLNPSPCGSASRPSSRPAATRR